VPFSGDFFINIAQAATLSTNPPPVQPSEKIGPDEAPSLLIGEWIIAPVNDFKPGELIVKDEKYYTMTRWDNETSGATLTGEYKFDVSEEIYAIDFCLGECGQPGSEWTTQVGILRFISKDAMEIQFSSDGKRLTQFSPKDNDFYFLRLTRKKQNKRTEILF
jgi:hypothetical protein